MGRAISPGPLVVYAPTSGVPVLTERSTGKAPARLTTLVGHSYLIVHTHTSVLYPS